MKKVYPMFLPMILLAACSTPPELPNSQQASVSGVNFRYAVKGHGRPVVVFESGFATPMGNWHKVFPEISSYTTAFTYNRRGYSELEGANETDGSIAGDMVKTLGSLALDTVAPGVSTAVDVAAAVHQAATETGDESAADAARTAQTIVKDLRALLQQTGTPPPYILVGHSMGGLYSLYYAKTYPEEVAGLVLVDASHPQQVERCREKLGNKVCEGPWLVRMVMKALPDEVYAEWRGREVAGREVMEAGPLPSIPLLVMTRGRSEKDGGSANNPFSDSEWLALQQELVELSPDSRHIVAKNSGHFIQQDEPELVIQAIRDVIDRVQADRVRKESISTTDISDVEQTTSVKYPMEAAGGS